VVIPVVFIMYFMSLGGLYMSRYTVILPALGMCFSMLPLKYKAVLSTLIDVSVRVALTVYWVLRPLGERWVPTPTFMALTVDIINIARNRQAIASTNLCLGAIIPPHTSLRKVYRRLMVLLRM